jgi:hypothetical protein
MKQRKAQIIKARVSTDMKRGIDNLAVQRGESEAVILREAISEYLMKSAIALKGKRSYRTPRKLVPTVKGKSSGNQRYR